MHVEPVADLTGEAGHADVHARDRDRDVGMIARAGSEEVGEQRERVEVAVEAQRLLALERTPDRPEREHVFPQLRSGMFERHREPALDVGLHLAAQTEGEPALARPGELPRGLRGDHGAAWERDRDRGTELDL